MKKLYFILLGCCCTLMSALAANPAYDSDLDSKRMKAPKFSHDHGYYDKAINVSISTDHSGATIMYTTDGSEPTAQNGKVYTSPLNISKTTVLRACVLVGEGRSYNSRITTRSYLFIEDIMRQGEQIEGYPSEWGPYARLVGTAKADYGMDPELTATQAQRDSITQGFLSLPVVSIVTDKSYIFNHENDAETGGIYIWVDPPTGYTKIQVADPGHKWMRPTSVEFFDQEGDLSIQADCGLRLHGGHSRLPEKSPKHGLRLVFKAEYGAKKLKANIFGPTQAKKIDHIVLRGGFCNTWIHANVAEREKAAYTRDAWAKEVQAAMGHPHSHQRFSHLFINGIYWGLYNITERIDSDWCEEYLGGDEGDYDVIKVEDDPQEVIADNGSLNNWQKLFTLSEQSASDENYQAICQLLDMENFIDYMIINIYGGNTDWDNHNWLAVKDHTDSKDGFKMLCWDSEHVLKDVNQDVGLGKLKALCPSTLMQNLMKYPQFCRQVGDHIQKQCFHQGPLEPTNTTDIWLRLSAEIGSALHCEAARWGDYRRDVHSWNTEPYEVYTKATHYDPLQKKMLEEILPYRRDVFVNQMIAKELYPTVQAPVILVNGELARSKSYYINDIVTFDDSDGKIYYSLDGSDPVLWDANGKGSLSSAAKEYQKQEFMLEPAAFSLKARVLKNNEWSALSELTLVASNITTDIVSEKAMQDLHLEKSVQGGLLQLRYAGLEGKEISVALLNLNGQMLWEKRYTHLNHQGQINIDIHNLAAGAYILQCRQEHQQANLKFIKP